MSGDRDFQLGGLEGETNGDGVTDTLDSAYVQARFALPLSSEDRVRADVNVDGQIDSSDTGAVLSRIGFSVCP